MAEHKIRKAGVAETDTRAEPQPVPGNRAAEAAARVAARYAKAPSYSEMLADEARAAVRAAEAASRAALQAQAAAEHVLAGLEAASSATADFAIEKTAAPLWEDDRLPAPAPALVRRGIRAPLIETATSQAAIAEAVAVVPATNAATNPSSALPSFRISWDADMPVREAEPVMGQATHGGRQANGVAQPCQPPADAQSPLHTEGFEVVEAALPIHANLIEFPRELVATRKVRPRRAEGPLANVTDDAAQLSIFEVDPASISTVPEAGASREEMGTTEWIGPKWSGITLDEEPPLEMTSARQARAEHAAGFPYTAAALPETAAAMQPAAMNLRIMAALVDVSLVAGSFLAAATATAMRMKMLPAMKTLELDSALGLAGIGVVYVAFFLTLTGATPGMRYAQLELKTFDGQKPTLKQRLGRAGALMLSLLPIGLGVALAMFDDQHLCWHDRLSDTYTRKG